MAKRQYSPVCLQAAHGTHNPQKRVDLYNQILHEYHEATVDLAKAGGGSACSMKFRELIERDYPEIFSRLVSTSSTKRSVTITTLHKLLFPTPVCVECGSHIVDRLSMFCSGVCTNLNRYGVANPMQSKQVRDKGIATNLNKRGVEYASQCPEVKAKKVVSSLRHFGVDNPSKAQVVKDQKVKTNMRNRGVDNPMKDPSVVTSMADKYEEEHGVRWSLQNPEVQEKGRVRNQLVRGVDYAMQCPEVKAKREENCLEKRGVSHHFHIPEILEKAQRSARTIKSYAYQGRSFEVQSTYEAFVFGKLADKYGIDDVLTQFDEDFPDYAFQEMGTHPDLYVKSIDLFVEVKSVWTLVGMPGSFTSNRAKAKKADESGNKERWVVAFPGEDRFVLLPRNWYAMSRNYLENCVLE